jgi:hypothetical protein
MALDWVNGAQRGSIEIIDHKQEPADDRPYIVLDPKDGAGLASSVRTMLIGNNPPAAIWKNAVYSDLDKYNQFDGRWQQVVFERARGNENFADEFLKIQPGRVIAADRLPRIKHRFGFESFEFPQAVLRYPLEPVENTDRPIDASFAGWMDYSGSEWLHDHRTICCREIEKLNGLIFRADHPAIRTEVSRGRKMNLADYWQSLFRTKVIVAPWGNGETTIRFYESIIAGCLVITPPVDWIDELPAHFVCKSDFSDLPEVLVKAVEWFDNSNRLELRGKLLERYNPREIGKALWADITESRTLHRQDQAPRAGLTPPA